MNARAADWTNRVNAVATKKQQSRWELSLSRSQPFGDDDWTAHAVKLLGLEHTVRGEGGNQYDRGCNARKPLAASPYNSPATS